MAVSTEIIWNATAEKHEFTARTGEEEVTSNSSDANSPNVTEEIAANNVNESSLKRNRENNQHSTLKMKIQNLKAMGLPEGR